MAECLRKHKEVMKSYPREGAGLEAFVDSSDTGYTTNNKAAEGAQTKNIASKSLINDDVKSGLSNGAAVNGASQDKKAATNAASGPEGVEGLANGSNGLANGKANGAH